MRDEALACVLDIMTCLLLQSQLLAQYVVQLPNLLPSFLDFLLQVFSRIRRHRCIGRGHNNSLTGVSLGRPYLGKRCFAAFVAQFGRAERLITQSQSHSVTTLTWHHGWAGSLAGSWVWQATR